MEHILLFPEVEAKLQELPDNTQLPTLPTIYTRLRSAISEPNTDVKGVANIIENDPSTSLEVLRVVNSAAFGLRTRAATVERAVSMLGFEQVSNIVLATTILKQMPTQGGRTIDFRKFWLHSLAVAAGAQVLCRHARGISKAVADSSFLAGLVHDIGKIIEVQYFSSDFDLALNKCKTDLLTLTQAEYKIFGFSHQETGAYLMDKWGIDRSLVKAVEFHNTPQDLDMDDPSYMLVSLIHASNLFVHYLMIGESGDPFIPTLDEDCFAALSLPMDRLDEILAEIKQASDDFSSFLS